MYRPDVPSLTAPPPEARAKKAAKRVQHKQAVRRTPNTLLEAVMHGDLHALRYLCAQHIALPATDEDELAMRTACKTGSAEMVAMLLTAGLDPHLGIPCDHPEIVQLLQRQPGMHRPMSAEERAQDTLEITAMICY